MKILLISSYLPYPLLSGGQVRLYNLIEQLSKKHEITLICEKRPYQEAKDIAEIEKICKEVITVDRDKQWSLSNIIKAGFSSNSFLLTGHTISIFQHKPWQEDLRPLCETPIPDGSPASRLPDDPKPPHLAGCRQTRPVCINWPRFLGCQCRYSPVCREYLRAAAQRPIA